MIRLVVTDLDGTLLDKDLKVPTKVAGALEDLEKQGIQILVATSHTARVATRLLQQNNLLYPAVLLTGALVRDLRSGETLHSKFFDTETASLLLEKFLSNSYVPCLTVDHETYDVVTGPAFSSTPTFVVEPDVTIVDLSEIIDSTPVYDFFIVGRGEKELRDLQLSIGESDKWNSFVFPEVFHGGYTLAVPGAGVDKWLGVQAYCERYGILANEVLAVGDGENDISMLVNAGVSCAMPNARQEVKGVAQYVLSEEKGWIDLLKYLE